MLQNSEKNSSFQSAGSLVKFDTTHTHTDALFRILVANAHMQTYTNPGLHTHTHTDSFTGMVRREGEPRANCTNTDLWTPAN